MYNLNKVHDGTYSVLACDAEGIDIAAYSESDNKIYVLDGDNFTEKYTVNGKPSSMCFDIYGRLAYCDCKTESVVRNDYYGPVHFAAEFKGEKTFPKSIMVHTSGIFVLLGQKRLYHVVPEGRGLLDACNNKDISYRTMCMAYGESGPIFVKNDKKRIVTCDFNPDGTIGKEMTLVFETEFGDENPQQIVTDKHGNIYCATEHKVYVFTKTGRKDSEFDCEGVKGICYSKERNMVYLSLKDGIYSMEVAENA